jgi:hypothetical protein
MRLFGVHIIISAPAIQMGWSVLHTNRLPVVAGRSGVDGAWIGYCFGSGETWISTELLHANLMTGLVHPAVGRFIPQPLESESVITDGQWHHIGLV